MFEVPILLIVWRRPDAARRVIEQIREVAPVNLYIACDGPREGKQDEADRVAETRRLVEREIDWQCRVNKRYNDKNLGCFRGVSGAINWFFEHVEQGIILEDDCVPHPDFFGYCEELLDRYKNHRNIWCISGDNSADIRSNKARSYTFVGTPLIWGWATWRRAWRNYDPEMAKWQKIRDSKIPGELFQDALEREIMTGIYDSVSGTNDKYTWDFQWCAAVKIHHGLCITPTVNLITNIGFDDDAVHTKWITPRANQPTSRILPLRHPDEVCLDIGADKMVFEKVFDGANLRRMRHPVIKRLDQAIRQVRIITNFISSRIELAITDPKHYPRKFKSRFRTLKQQYLGPTLGESQLALLFTPIRLPNMKDRSISIAVPTFNSSKLAHLTLFNTINDPRIGEIIFLDDGSAPDDFEHLVKKLTPFRKKIKLFHRKENLGAFANKLQAVSLCESSWVILLDCDNTLCKSYFDAIFSIAAWDDSIIYCPGFAAPSYDFREMPCPDELYLEDVVRLVDTDQTWYSFLNDGNFFVNRNHYLETLTQYQFFDVSASDVLFANYLWLSAGYRLQLLRNATYRHRVHPESFWSKNAKMATEVLEIIDQRLRSGEIATDKFDTQLQAIEFANPLPLPNRII